MDGYEKLHLVIGELATNMVSREEGYNQVLDYYIEWTLQNYSLAELNFVIPNDDIAKAIVHLCDMTMEQFVSDCQMNLLMRLNNQTNNLEESVLV